MIVFVIVAHDLIHFMKRIMTEIYLWLLVNTLFSLISFQKFGSKW